jgi:hypothetical protein
MIIGINGKISSGKDTVGKIIQHLTSDWADEEFQDTDMLNVRSDWKIKKFAGKLKQIATLLTGVPIEKWEDQNFKKQEMPRVWGVTKQVMEADENNQDGYSTDLMTYREFLQKLGTEAMRNGLHPDVWVNALMADYKDVKQSEDGLIHEKYGEYDITIVPNPILWSNYYPNWIISDLRFPNEYDAVTGKQGICIRVEKPCQYCNGLAHHKISCVKLYQTQHASETALDNHVFDYVINNTGTLKDLVKEVKKMLLHFNLLKA